MIENLIEIIVHTDDALLAIVAENVLLAYTILFLIIMLETGLIVFPFLPGDGLLFSAGVVAASTNLNVWILLLLLIIAAIVGNLINYTFGNILGHKLKNSSNFVIKKFLKQLSKAEDFYIKQGEKAIVFGRFLPVIRTYIPFFAGMVQMNFKLFAKYTLIGAVSWISSFLLLGFFIGEVPWVKNNYGIIFIGLIIVTLIPLVLTLGKSIVVKKSQ